MSLVAWLGATSAAPLFTARTALGEESGAAPAEQGVEAGQKAAEQPRATERYREEVPSPMAVGTRPTERYREEVPPPMAVGTRPDGRIAELLAGLKGGDPEAHQAARKALVSAGEKAVAAIVAESKDSRRELFMTGLLAEIGPRGGARLLELVRDPVLGSYAAAALSRIADPGWRDHSQGLLDCMRSVPAAKGYCGMALVKAMSPKAKAQVGPLLAALREPDGQVRAYAAAALGQIGPKAKEAVPALAEALKDGDGSVRLAAAVALGKLGRKAREASPALEASLQDKDGEVRRAAQEALKRIRG